MSRLRRDLPGTPAHLSGFALPRHSSRTPRRRRRGQAVIEMAMVMGLLMVLSMGIVDSALFFTGYLRATNCTREAARAAVVRTANAGNICNNDMLSALFSSYTVTVSPSNYMTAAAGNSVTVTINATYSWGILGPTINAFIPGGSLPGTNVTVQTTMRLEGKKI